MKRLQFMKTVMLAIAIILFINVSSICAYADGQPVEESNGDDIQIEEFYVNYEYERKKGKIKLKWDNLSDVESMTVYRRKKDTEYTKIGTVEANKNTYEDTTVNSMDEYYYRFDITWTDGYISTIDEIKVEPLRTVGGTILIIGASILGVILKLKRRRA